MADKKQTPKFQNQQKSKEEEEEEEPLQALRLKALAEQKYTSGDLTSALKYAKRAHNLRPNLAGVSEMLTAFNILNTARQAPDDNYYKFLQVERFSHINTIKKQYKKLALILHPDKNPFVASEEAFKLVGEAFRVLSDKVRRNEYDMKLRISMQAEAVGPVEEGEGEGEEVDTFWTACSTCRLLHKFERKYLGHNLVCPSCKKSFKAVEVSENVKEGEEEENSGVGQMRGSARVRERKGGKLRDSEKGLSEGKRKIDSVGKVSERSKGKMAKTMGGNEGKSEGLRPKEVEKGNYEGAGGDAESGGMIGGLRLRSGRKVRVGGEVEERTRTKRVNVGEEEMVTLAEMQTIAKRKLSEEKMKVKGKEKEREEVKVKGKEKKGEEVKEKEKEKEEERGKEKEKEKEEERGKEIDKEEKEEERRKEKEKVQEEEREKEIDKEIGEEEIAVVMMKEKRETQGISKNENLGVVKRRASEASAIEKEKELEEIRGKEIEKEEKEGERRKEKEKVQEDEREKEKAKEIGEGESVEEMAVVKMKEKRERRGISKNENVGVVKRRASETLGIEKEKELEELKENEKEKEWKEGTEKEKENGAEREKKEMAMVKVREKRERRKTWKLESLEVEKRREEKMKEKEREEETETSIVNVKEKRDRRKTSKIESLKVMKRRKEKETEKEMEEEIEKETETIMIKVKEKRDRRKTSKNESLEVMKTRCLKSGNMEVKKHKESRQSSLEIVALEDSDFYDFGKDRLGRNFKKGQVWALYDDDDGMPRHYAVIDEVVSVNPFELRLNWLEFQSNGDEALISWEKLGFRVSCGRFKVSTSIVVKSLKIFSHVADCERAARELYRIYPKKGSVWAIYNENALDAEGRNLTVKNKRCYDIVVFLTTYSEMHGLSMAYLEKVDGFRTVFQRREIGAHAIRWLEKEDYRLFSHQIPARKLSGEEASGLPKDCWELDPASIPPESLTIGWER